MTRVNNPDSVASRRGQYLSREPHKSVQMQNIKMMLMTQGKSQTALADALGVQRAAISKKIRGSVSWSLADLVRAADFLDTDISTLLDDSLMKQLQGMGNRKATGDTPMASGELLRLGLNQRPSD